MSRLPTYKRDAGAGFAAAFLALWFFILCAVLAFWGLVAYGIWTGIQYLQSH